MSIFMAKDHNYTLTVTWTGNAGQGTAGYRAYERSYQIGAHGKEPIAGSADPAYRGDAKSYNPEELLVASLSACHMLWYLHLCAVEGIVVTGYEDIAEGIMVEDETGSGRFTEVVLQPEITLSAGDVGRARTLHDDAHAKCFIANSVNFPIRLEPVFHQA